MGFTPSPNSLECTVCDEPIEQTGYLPATERDEGYEPMPDDAVCDACGFNSIGMMGCAPELGDVIDPAADDVLLYIDTTGDGIEVISEKE
ncbi:MAG: hypothetical protein ABEH65_10955 [Halobacteriales archaeon]